MNSSRREALRSAALFGGALFIARGLAACGADAGDGNGDNGEVDQNADALVTCGPPAISANHGHSLVVAPADVAAGVAKTYSIQGSAGHDHQITLTPAQFSALSSGHKVTVVSTNDLGHTHTVTVSCAVAAASCVNGAKAATISANHGHSLFVPNADVVAGVAKTYPIQGTATHSHTVSVTAAQFTLLQRGKKFTVTSTTGAGHSHSVTVACA